MIIYKSMGNGGMVPGAAGGGSYTEGLEHLKVMGRKDGGGIPGVASGPTTSTFPNAAYQVPGAINNPTPGLAKGGGLSRSEDYGSKEKPYPSVKSGDFAGGGRSYPIPTRADAVDALRLAGMHGRSDVKAKVYAKYPGLKKKQMGGELEPQQGQVQPMTGATSSQMRQALGAVNPMPQVSPMSGQMPVTKTSPLMENGGDMEMLERAPQARVAPDPVMAPMQFGRRDVFPSTIREVTGHGQALQRKAGISGYTPGGRQRLQEEFEALPQQPGSQYQVTGSGLEGDPLRAFKTSRLPGAPAMYQEYESTPGSGEYRPLVADPSALPAQSQLLYRQTHTAPIREAVEGYRGVLKQARGAKLGNMGMGRMQYEGSLYTKG